MPRYIVRNDYGSSSSVGTRPLTCEEAIESLQRRTGAAPGVCAAAVDGLWPAPMFVGRTDRGPRTDATVELHECE